MGGMGVCCPPIFSNVPETWSKVSHAARELVTACSMTCLFFSSNNSWSIGQKVPPPHGECLSTSLHIVMQTNDGLSLLKREGGEEKEKEGETEMETETETRREVEKALEGEGREYGIRLQQERETKDKSRQEGCTREQHNG